MNERLVRSRQRAIRVDGMVLALMAALNLLSLGSSLPPVCAVQSLQWA